MKHHCQNYFLSAYHAGGIAQIKLSALILLRVLSSKALLPTSGSKLHL